MGIEDGVGVYLSKASLACEIAKRVFACLAFKDFSG